MARRYTAATVALLVVVQVAAAFVVPEVVLMRVKRNPDPMRSYSFSGFDPNGQMAAFTGMSAYPMFGNGYGPPPRAGPYHHHGPPPALDSYGQSTQDSYAPPPSGAEQPQPAEPNAPKLQQGGGAAFDQRPQEYGPRPGGGAPVESNEPNDNSVEQPDANNKKQYNRGRDGPSSNAEASFNAWFPIMFGVFPNGASGAGQSGNTAGRGNNPGQQGTQDQGPGNGNSNSGGYERLSGGTTVIANSVSNGRHGVATSHAIAYGNPRSASQK